MAIVDTDNMMSAPKGLTCASGIDVMTHALEAYASMMASDYTDGLALNAIKLVFNYLPRAYKDGSDVEARQHMANASCMAGMAFANAFLGVNHSLAHKLGLSIIFHMVLQMLWFCFMFCAIMQPKFRLRWVPSHSISIRTHLHVTLRLAVL